MYRKQAAEETSLSSVLTVFFPSDIGRAIFSAEKAISKLLCYASILAPSSLSFLCFIIDSLLLQFRDILRAQSSKFNTLSVMSINLAVILYQSWTSCMIFNNHDFAELAWYLQQYFIEWTSIQSFRRPVSLSFTSERACFHFSWWCSVIWLSWAEFLQGCRIHRDISRTLARLSIAVAERNFWNCSNRAKIRSKIRNYWYTDFSTSWICWQTKRRLSSSIRGERKVESERNTHRQIWLLSFVENSKINDRNVIIRTANVMLFCNMPRSWEGYVVSCDRDDFVRLEMKLQK